MPIVSDLIDHPVIPGKSALASALGTAWLSGLTGGYLSVLETISQQVSHGQKHIPALATNVRAAIPATGQDGVNRTLGIVG